MLRVGGHIGTKEPFDWETRNNLEACSKQPVMTDKFAVMFMYGIAIAGDLAFYVEK
jgi:hypothetical protein